MVGTMNMASMRCCCTSARNPSGSKRGISAIRLATRAARKAKAFGAEW